MQAFGYAKVGGQLVELVSTLPWLLNRAMAGLTRWRRLLDEMNVRY
jgi:hypothetical protein